MSDGKHTVSPMITDILSKFSFLLLSIIIHSENDNLKTFLNTKFSKHYYIFDENQYGTNNRILLF